MAATVAQLLALAIALAAYEGTADDQARMTPTALASRLFLGYISAISRLYLGYISRQEVHVVGKLLLGMILAPFFACARYRLGEFNQNSPSLPLVTLGVNLLAAVSLLMSILT